MKKIYGFLTLLLLTALSVQAQDLTIRSDKKGRLGYFDEDGKEVIKCQFDEAEPFINGYARVLKGEDYGIINEKGKFVSGKYSVMTEYADTEYYLVAEGGSDIKPAKPGKAEKPIKSRAGVSEYVFKGSMQFPIKGAKWGVVDRNGKELIKVEYDEVSYPINGVIYVIQGGKTGFYDLNMHLVLKPTYTYMGAFNQHGITWVMVGGKAASSALLSMYASSDAEQGISTGTISGGRMGIIDRMGKLIVMTRYKYVSTFIPLMIGEFSSLAPQKFLSSPFSELPNCEGENYIWATNKFKKDIDIYDLSGRPVVTSVLNKYDKVYMPTEGMMRFYREGKKKIPDTWGFYNLSTGKELITDSDYAFGPYVNGLSRAWRRSGDKDYFFVDKNLREVSAHYDLALEFNEGYCVVKKNDLYGVIDPSGREIISPSFAQMSDRFSEGVVAAAVEPKSDTNVANMVLNATTFGKATVAKNNVSDMQSLIGGIRGGGHLVCGYINAAGQVVVPFEYSAVGDFHNGRALVCKEGNIGIVGIDGKVVLPIEWEEVKYHITTMLHSDYFWVKKDGRYYYYDMERGTTLFPNESSGYDEVFFFDNRDLAVVRRGGTKDRSETTQTGEGHDWSTVRKGSGMADLLSIAEEVAKVTAAMKGTYNRTQWESTGAVYGAVNREGIEIVPCQFEFQQVERAWQYMQKNSLTSFRDVDLKRFSIILRGTSNMHRLSDTIASDEWDY